MGRCIYDTKGTFVWKYAFGGQDSEQYRVVEELGIGHHKAHDTYSRYTSSDRLSLSRYDLERLKAWVKPHRKALADYYRDSRKVFGKTHSASFPDVKKMENRHPDIYFRAMCNQFVKKGKAFFKEYPKSRQWHLIGEM
jgi:hypothetical protein